jgi:hypothetical protein
MKNTEKSQVNDFMLYLKLLEKQEQAKHKISRRVIIKIRAEINKIEEKNYTKNQQNKKLILQKDN